MTPTQLWMEHDYLGDGEVPADAYYGVQTLRGKENFHITAIPISREPYFVAGAPTYRVEHVQA